MLVQPLYWGIYGLGQCALQPLLQKKVSGAYSLRFKISGLGRFEGFLHLSGRNLFSQDAKEGDSSGLVRGFLFEGQD